MCFTMRVVLIVSFFVEPKNFGSTRTVINWFTYLSCEGANFEDRGGMKANLEGAKLKGAHLEDCNFSGANLRASNLRGCNLENANLRRADLAGMQAVLIDIKRYRC